MGGRGERPVLFLTSIAGAWLAGILAIPGVRRVFGGLQCAWDVAWAVARLSNLPEPPEPTAIGDLPGLADYQQLQLHEKTRPYQKDAILFAARRAYAILAHPMRSGKTLIAIGTAIVIGSRRTLIVGPSITKWNWAEEVAVWAKESALVLDGRAGREGRSFCVTCRGKGRLADDSLCVDCRQRNGQSYGYRLHYVEMMEPEYEGPEDARYAPLPTTFRCVRHKDQTTHRPYTLCPVCRQNFHRVIEDSRWVIINYDLLTPQEHELGGGQKILRADLDGWIRELTEYHAFDLGLCDEAHMLRGWSTSTDRAGYTRRERVRQLFRRVPRVLAITGTPFWGRVRDIWGILDVISNGLFGDPTRVPGKEFMLRYCEGRAGSFGFEANGRSVYADTELVERLKRIMLKPSRAEIFSYLPPIMRRVIRLELPRARPFRLTGNRAQSLANAIKSVADQKRELILESLCDEIAEGNKIIVFCFHVDTATRWLKAFEEAFAERTQRRRMAEVRAKAWLVTSESPASPRAKLLSATQFREHDGAGVFIATIDSMSVGISLRGASSLHFVDLHWSPGALFQAEDRAWYPESAGVALNYYVGLRSVDEHVEQVVLPKVEHICRLTRDAQATAVMDAMQGPASAERTLEAIYERHVAHLREPAALHLDPDGE